MEKNIIGLDLNIDQNYLAQAVQQTVMMGIAEALNGKNEITSQIVYSVFNTKVDKNGKISSYDRDNRYSLLEFYVKELLTDVVKEEIKCMVNEKRPEISTLIRKELSKRATVSKFTDNFISTISESLDSVWRTRIDINLEQDCKNN